MDQNQLVAITAGLLIMAGSSYALLGTEFTKGMSPEDGPKTNIEVLSEPVAGQSNTLQAQKNGTPLSGEKLYIDGESYGELNKAGIKEFKVPEKQEIEIRVSDTSKTLKVDQETNQTSETSQKDYSSPKEGLSLKFSPESGKYNYVTLYNNSEPVEGKEIFVNGESIGKTNPQGEVGFKVPNAQEITVSAKEAKDIDKTVSGFQAGNISLNSPDDGSEFEMLPDGSREEVSFDAVIDLKDSEEAYLVINGETKFEKNLSGEQSSISETLSLTKGTYNWKVNVSAAGKTYSSDSQTFRVVTSEGPRPEISINNPQSEESISDYGATFNYRISHVYDYEYNLTLDGQTIDSGSEPDGSSTFALDKNAIPEGDHNVELKATDSKNNSKSKSITFSTTEEVPIGELRFASPTNNTNYNPSRFEKDEIPVRLRINSFEPSVDYSILLNGSEIKEGTLQDESDGEVEVTEVIDFQPSEEYSLEAVLSKGENQVSTKKLYFSYK